MPFFVAATASDKDLALSLVLQFLLIDALWTDYEANVVDALELGQEDLGSESLAGARLGQVLCGYSRNALV